MANFTHKDFTGQGYTRFMNSDAKIKILKGSKNSKKSYVAVYKILQKMFANPNCNPVVIRKNIATNRTSTFNTFKQVLHLMGHKTGRNLYDEFKFIKSPNPLIIRKSTGQQIEFWGLNRADNVSGWQAAQPGGYCDTVWFEELIEQDDFGEKIETQDNLKQKMAIKAIESSLFRGFDDKAKPEIIYTFNPWVLNHWIYDDYFDIYMQDNEEILDTIGQQIWEGNVGRDTVLLMTVNWQLNEFITDSQAEAMLSLKENDPELYKVQGLGISGAPPDSVFGRIIKYIEVVDIDTEHLQPLAIGIDVGVGIDPTVCYLIATDPRDLFDKLYVLRELYLDPQKGIGTHDNARLITEQVAKWINIVASDTKLSARMNGIGINIDVNNENFSALLMERCIENGVHDKYNLSYNHIKEKSSGMKIKNRIMWWSHMIAESRVVIDKSCNRLLLDFPKQQRCPKQGRVDVNTDTFNAAEYAWMPFHGEFSNKRITARATIRYSK